MVRKSVAVSAVAVAVTATFPACLLAQFSVFTPLSSSVPAGSLPESAPFLLANPAWTQQSIADRATQLGLGEADSGNWDMTTANETGANAGRYLFSPFETGTAGVKRTDLLTLQTKTVVAPGAGSFGFVSGDASRWAPWGGYLTAEESWGGGSTKGRLFELTNPVTTTDSTTSNFVLRGILPRVSHEGLVFDKNKSLYFVDELNGGSIYRFTPSNPNAVDGNGYFSAGQSSVLRVGDGSVFGAAGAATWIAMTDTSGAGLPGAATLTGGIVDGRATADIAAFKGTEYNRPEDMEIQNLVDGSQRIYVPTTDTNQVFSIHLKNDGSTEVKVFADRNTIDAATGLPVGSAFTNPDNMAIDSQGNMYLVEDQPGGVADIWFATDSDRDGVAESIARWASMSTAGAEPTGLYFDTFDPTVAYINVQHPGSGVDRTIRISSVPEPGIFGILALSVSLFGFRRRQR
jgi:secreted PhoX family phosphatase